MTSKEIIKLRLKEEKKTQIELAEQMQMTKQNLNNKMLRDNFTIQELCKIAKVLDFKIVAKYDKGKEYIISYE